MAKQNRKHSFSGTNWEEIVGYSRGVRVGNTIEIAGTTAIDAKNEVVGMGDAYKQTQFIISKAEKALKELGSSLDDVVRTRMYTTDIELWEDIGKAHGEFFRTIKPASTLVEVQRLINPDLLIEIEFTAIH
jgi:enamine deaminase RidA (YjgF/YER057c/UK114 family)